jgi:hypothetical protein
MKHIFYILAICPIMWELTCISNPKRVAKFRDGFKKLKKENIDFDKYSSTQKLFGILMIGYIIWNFIGFLTFQWTVFLGLFLLGLIPKPWTWLRWIDSIISFAILLFIIINAYHLKIDVYAWLKSFLA